MWLGQKWKKRWCFQGSFWWLGFFFLSHFRINHKRRDLETKKNTISRSIELFSQKFCRKCITAFLLLFVDADARRQTANLQFIWCSIVFWTRIFERKKCNDIIKIKRRKKSSFLFVWFDKILKLSFFMKFHLNYSTTRTLRIVIYLLCEISLISQANKCATMMKTTSNGHSLSRAQISIGWSLNDR